jgi:glycosyltransferase involved in cell wall biosynthesis
LRQAINAAKEWKAKDPVVAVRRDGQTDGPDDPLLWPLRRDEVHDYRKMAHKLNASDIDVVSLQHEFGIFGGEAGRHVLELVRALEKPLVTTFHTVFEHPQEPYASIQREIAERSSRIIVMNRLAVGFLNDAFGIPKEKIVFIPHGTPEPDAERRARFRQELGWHDRKVLMTFGLLSRGKGLERILGILPDIAREVPDVLYAIVGQTHPEVKKWEGESYREELQAMIRRLGIESHVVMIDRYLEEGDLVRHLTACDLYVTPYPGLEQITSGTLAYAVGLGRPVLSTPYRYALDLLQDLPELIIPYDDEETWKNRIVSLLTNDLQMRELMRKVKEIGEPMHWPQVGRQHLQLFREVNRVASSAIGSS